jgi:hypothetical protein
MTAPFQLDLLPHVESPAIGMLVELDRTIDRERPCHDNLALVHAGRGPHAAELRCATCNQHRGWLPKAAADFIATTGARFGAPETLVLRDNTIGDVPMTKHEFDNTNTGALFKNGDKQQGDAQPDMRGSVNIEGREYWLSAWVKIAKKDGRKFMSLSVKPKDENKSKTTVADDLNKSMPW